MSALGATMRGKGAQILPQLAHLSQMYLGLHFAARGRIAVPHYCAMPV